jgi:hypothetical protein
MMNFLGHLPKLVTRMANTLFFDDLRVENTGKLLLLGVYPDILYVPQFPATLDIKAMINVTTPSSQPFIKMVIHGLYNDDVVARLDTDYSNLETEDLSPAKSDHPDIVPVVRFSCMLRIGPHIVNEPGALRIRVETESEVIPAGALYVSAVDAG